MFREAEEKKFIDTDHLAAAPTNADEVNTDAQKGSDSKYTFGPL